LLGLAAILGDKAATFKHKMANVTTIKATRPGREGQNFITTNFMLIVKSVAQCQRVVIC
jgi:hypothetical protein